MRKAARMISLVGLTLVALAGTVRAQETAARGNDVRGACCALSKTFSWAWRFCRCRWESSRRRTAACAFRRTPRLRRASRCRWATRSSRYFSVGLAPQVLFNVGTKEDPTGAGHPVVMSTEYDFMARLVGSHPAGRDDHDLCRSAAGVLVDQAIGWQHGEGIRHRRWGGCRHGPRGRMFVNLGVGYQQGYQIADRHERDRGHDVEGRRRTCRRSSGASRSASAEIVESAARPHRRAVAVLHDADRRRQTADRRSHEMAGGLRLRAGRDRRPSDRAHSGDPASGSSTLTSSSTRTRPGACSGACFPTGTSSSTTRPGTTWRSRRSSAGSRSTSPSRARRASCPSGGASRSC